MGERHLWTRSFSRARLISAAAIVAALALIAANLFSAAAVAPSNPAFERTWARTDKPVADGQAHRTWMWGPSANTSAMQEDYAEAPGGKRTVQYFDKARMEINDPSGDESSLWYVTNGLLVSEMITGQIQTGDAQHEPRTPANDINVAGDPDDADGPTYGSFGSLLDAAPAADGAAITQRLARDGAVTTDNALAAYGVTAAHRVTVTDIDHTVASVFWDFMNSSGTVYEDGQYVEANLFVNPFYATGYPISEAYWANVKVAGTEQDVLIQCFERRCLTFTPGNLDGWKVEAGNVGQHYFRWRYDSAVTPTPPTPTPPPTEPGVTEAVYAAHLIGANEIPAVESDATADAYFYVRPDGTGIDYTITAHGLENAMAAHIHEGAANENGDVIVTLFGSDDPVTTNGVLVSGTITADDLAEGWTLESLANGMADGSLYVNVHTSAHESGEIRGQLGVLGDTSFSTILLGQNEIPPTGSTAVGAAALTYNAADATISFDVYVLNLSNVTMAHIHIGDSTTNGPVAALLFHADPAVTGPVNGTLNAGTVTAGDLKDVSMPRLVYLMLTNGTYVNVHTTDHPAGEIRGQVAVGSQSQLDAASYLAELSNTVETDFTSMYMPIETDGSGLALFWVNEDGTALNYYVIVTNLDRILSANLVIDNDVTEGEAVASLFDSTSNATGAVNGVLASGTLTAEDLFGPLGGSDIAGLIANIDAGSIYTSVQTVQNPAADIWGLVEPIS